MSTRPYQGVSSSVPSYFALSGRGEDSDTNSSDVSSISDYRAPPTPKPMRTRLRPVTPHGRSSSQHDDIHSRVKSQTIEEDNDGQPATRAGGSSQRNLRPLSRRSYVSDDVVFSLRSESKSRSHPPSPSSLRDFRPMVARPQPTVFTSDRGLTDPPYLANSDNRLQRTASDSVYYEKKQSPAASSHTRDTNKSSESSGKSWSPFVRRRKSSMPQVTATVPLRPPMQPTTSGPVYHHTIKMETSFRELRPKQETNSKPLSTERSRSSSLRAKDIIAVPRSLLRRLSVNKSKAAPSPHEVASLKSEPEALDHSTSRKRISTSEALDQVSALLHGMAGNRKSTLPVVPRPKFVVNTRMMSSMSAQPELRKLASQPSMTSRASTGNLNAPLLFNRQKSMEILEVASYTSSIRRLKMGKTPNVTPDEKATYKVKRSPSAESEEFLKIDISIRGSTSYLPSEARRIHTPPLPQEGVHGKRRGFFFDYNAPDQKQNEPAADEHDKYDHDAREYKGGNYSQTLSQQRDRPAPRSERFRGLNPRRSTSRATTIDRKIYKIQSPGNGKGVRRAKTFGGADWYEAQLAEIDDDQEEVEDDTSASDESEDSRINIKEVKTRDGELERMDMNIPEHLPSSPLCPRHPKYWRIVDGKGSQYRGCCMHGVGIDWRMGRRAIEVVNNIGRDGPWEDGRFDSNYSG